VSIKRALPLLILELATAKGLVSNSYISHHLAQSVTRWPDPSCLAAEKLYIMRFSFNG